MEKNKEIVNDMQNTRPLTKEEFAAFSADMDELLKKHDCEIGVVSTIQIMKRYKEEGIKSPFVAVKDNGTDQIKKEETN